MAITCKCGARAAEGSEACSFCLGADWEPIYRRWRHGGWYVDNVRYPSGAVGCVSNNYPDKRWRIVCETSETTFATRDAAARAERVLAHALKEVERVKEVERQFAAAVAGQ